MSIAYGEWHEEQQYQELEREQQATRFMEKRPITKQSLHWRIADGAPSDQQREEIAGNISEREILKHQGYGHLRRLFTTNQSAKAMDQQAQEKPQQADHNEDNGAAGDLRTIGDQRTHRNAERYADRQDRYDVLAMRFLLENISCLRDDARRCRQHGQQPGGVYLAVTFIELFGECGDCLDHFDALHGRTAILPALSSRALKRFMSATTPRRRARSRPMPVTVRSARYYQSTHTGSRRCGRTRWRWADNHGCRLPRSDQGSAVKAPDASRRSAACCRYSCSRRTKPSRLPRP